MSRSPAPSLRPDSPLASAADQLLAELDQLFRARRQNHARIAHSLARAQRLELHKAYGFSSLAALAWERWQWGASKTSESIGIVKAGQGLPKIMAAFDAGTLHWTKAREITKVATPQDEHEWLRRSETESVSELRAARKGEEPKVQRVLSFTPEQAARFDQTLASVRDGLDLADAGLAVLAVLEGGGGALGESARARVVISECGTCHAATLASREGPVPVEPGVVAAARCAGEVHDLRRTENVVRRAIPAAIRRRVLDRDRRRCQVPRCQNLSFLEVHHVDGWKAGHDPSRMLVLCGAHHRQGHEGWLRIEGQAPEFRFRTRAQLGLGGAPGETGVAEFAREKSRPDGAEAAEFARSKSRPDEAGGAEFAREKSAPSRPQSSDEGRAVRKVAELALARLGMGARERRALLARVLEREAQRDWSEAELVRAALLAA